MLNIIFGFSCAFFVFKIYVWIREVVYEKKLGVIEGEESREKGGESKWQKVQEADLV